MNELQPATFAEKAPDRPAVVTDSGAVVTYSALEERSCRLAHALSDRGVGQGDHVAVVLPNDEYTHEVAWALQRSGLFYTFVNTHLIPEEAAYIVNDCGARALITSASLGTLAEGLLASTPKLETRIAIGGKVRGHIGYEDFVGGHPTHPLANEREGSAMLYSSGTTGKPKGVRRPITGNAFGTANALAGMFDGIMGFTEGCVYLSPAPLYHSAPLVWSMTAHRLGGTAVVMRQFDPTRCLELIAEHRVTHAQFVPTMFIRMLKLGDDERHRADLSSLCSVVHAAAPCPPEIKRRMIEWWGPIIHEYYSGTEGGGLTWITSEQWLSHPGSVGPAIWGDVHVTDDDGNELGPLVPGIVWFGGRANKFEYNNDVEKTNQTFNQLGWSTLWDVGYLDEDRYLYLTDRKLYMIVSGGVNIYPQEVEDVLVLHPDVADVAVFGVPNADMGEEVKAVVQAAEGVRADPELAERLQEFAHAHLAHFKCPRSIDFAESLPRGENGKLYKRLLRDPYWAEQDRRVG